MKKKVALDACKYSQCYGAGYTPSLLLKPSRVTFSIYMTGRYNFVVFILGIAVPLLFPSADGKNLVHSENFVCFVVGTNLSKFTAFCINEMERTRDFFLTFLEEVRDQSILLLMVLHRSSCSGHRMLDYIRL